MPSSPIFPAEWAPHEAVWTGWPSAPEEWENDLAPARADVAAMIRAIVRPAPEDEPDLHGEHVRLLHRGAEAGESAAAALEDLIAAGLVDLIDAPIGDIWLRDTGPIFTRHDDALRAAVFRFNGWGGKYVMPSDEKIAALVAETAGVEPLRSDIILEGGSVDTDGEGTILTTRQCLLNTNRNPGLTEKDAEAALKAMLGAQKVIWIDEGLMNDHTDGHVDNIARFVAPGKVVCMRPIGEDDPNSAVYAAILRALDGARDAAGRLLEIVEIPSPGRVLGADGRAVPASHINFYIANHCVVMPVYAETDEQHEAAQAALEILSDHIDRDYFHAIDARGLLVGGGSFHCITQPQPLMKGAS